MPASPVLSRLARTVLTLSVVVVAVFFMLRLSGDPVQALGGPDATVEELAFLAAKWGLDRPLHEQFLAYLGNLARGDFGISFSSGEPAAKLFMERVPATLMLGLASLVLSLAIGIPLGIVAALRHNTGFDRFVMSLSVLAFSMPNFFLGILFILLFSLQLRILPSFGAGSWQHMVMPTLTLALSGAGAIARFARSSMLDVLNQPYIRAARARGVKVRRRTWLHALPNAAIPLVTIMGLRVGDLIAGAIVVETVFAWPGIGRMLASAVAVRDVALVQIIVIATAVTMVTANLAVDLLYGWFDPRQRRD